MIYQGFISAREAAKEQEEYILTSVADKVTSLEATDLRNTSQVNGSTENGQVHYVRLMGDYAQQAQKN